jgi:hypothetical protein
MIGRMQLIVTRRTCLHLVGIMLIELTFGCDTFGSTFVDEHFGRKFSVFIADSDLVLTAAFWGSILIPPFPNLD